MTCRVVLDNPGVYHPGDSVFGRVVCDFHNRENFRAIRCRFRGREHTAWTERESYYDSSSKKTKYRTVHYSGDNKFLAVNIDLVGESSLPPGHYEYPFSFTFPRYNIPNPYNGNYGYIKYYIKGNVDIPFAFDYDDEVTLHLIAPINFNDIQSTLQLQPVSYQDEKVVCCLCCASDPITMDLALEKEAFVVGEVARIKVDVTNMSNESIEALNLTLKMTIESKTTSPRTSHKYDSELIAVTSGTGVGAHGQRVYYFDFAIPSSAVVPNFAGCSLFSQWCVLEAEGVIPGCHTNLDVDTGVKLGHIPILGGTAAPTYVPASQAPGGSFPPPPLSELPPYPPDDKAPPYPTGPSSSIVLNGDDIHFAGVKPPPPNKALYKPVPVHGEPSSASAPLEEEAASAPSKAQMAEEEGFELLDDNDDEPPPPSYTDSTKDPTAPSAPPK